MAEPIVRTVNGQGIVTAITNDRNEGWRVVVYRPDGTNDFRKVSDKAEAHRVISEMRNGYFFVPDPEPEPVVASPRSRRLNTI